MENNLGGIIDTSQMHPMAPTPYNPGQLGSNPIPASNPSYNVNTPMIGGQSLASSGGVNPINQAIPSAGQTPYDVMQQNPDNYNSLLHGVFPNTNLQQASQETAPQAPSPMNFFNQNGVQGNGGFLPGQAQIANSGSQPWNLNFEQVNHDPFAQNLNQNVTSTLRNGMYQQ